MGKQTMGTPCHSISFRNDNKLYKLQVLSIYMKCSCIIHTVFRPLRHQWFGHIYMIIIMLIITHWGQMQWLLLFHTQWVNPSICLNSSLSIHHLSIYLSICPTICLSDYLSSHLSIHLFHFTYMYLSIYLCIYLSVYLSIYV